MIGGVNSMHTQLHQPTLVANRFSPDIAKIVRAWTSRAQVRTYDDLHDLALAPDKDDFLESLLPFYSSNAFKALPDHGRRAVLSIGWVLYNQKTIQIENCVIVPACAYLLDHASGMLDWNLMHAVAQTMTDETFHAYLSAINVRVTNQHRQLQSARPQFELICGMGGYELSSGIGDYSHNRKTIELLAMATVSELFISDYLRQVSEASSIQPINQFSVKAHRLDEGIHALIFSEVVTSVLRHFRPEEAEFFGIMLAEAAVRFASNEISAWKSSLAQQGDECLFDLIDALSDIPSSTLGRHDFSKVYTLAEEHGLLKNRRVADHFAMIQARFC